MRREHAALAERLANGSAHGQSSELAQQLREVEAEAQRARADAQAAQAAGRKLEMDLEDLSAAYSTLDAHAGSLQQQVEQLQLQLQLAAEQRKQQQQGTEAPSSGSSSGEGGGISAAEVQRRVEAARQEAQQEADDAMGDLLVCLGQEEAKVGALCGICECMMRALQLPLSMHCAVFFVGSAAAELPGVPCRHPRCRWPSCGNGWRRRGWTATCCCQTLWLQLGRRKT